LLGKGRTRRENETGNNDESGDYPNAHGVPLKLQLV